MNLRRHEAVFLDHDMHHIPEWLFLVLIQMKYGNLVLVPVWLHLAWLHIGLPASW